MMAEAIKLTPINREFIEEVRRLSGQEISLCYQCGKCTATCPANFSYDYTANQIIRLISLGQKKKVFNSHSIWLCLSCLTCSARCPRELDIAAIFDVLRTMVLREPHLISEKRVTLFHNIFLSSIRNKGRVNEVRLLLSFNFKRGKIFNDLNLSPKLIGRGKLHFWPRKIKGRREIEKIYAKIPKLGEEINA